MLCKVVYGFVCRRQSCHMKCILAIVYLNEYMYIKYVMLKFI